MSAPTFDMFTREYGLERMRDSGKDKKGKKRITFSFVLPHTRDYVSSWKIFSDSPRSEKVLNLYANGKLMDTKFESKVEKFKGKTYTTYLIEIEPLRKKIRSIKSIDTPLDNRMIELERMFSEQALRAGISKSESQEGSQISDSQKEEKEIVLIEYPKQLINDTLWMGEGIILSFSIGKIPPQKIFVEENYFPREKESEKQIQIEEKPETEEEKKERFLKLLTSSS